MHLKSKGVVLITVAVIAFFIIATVTAFFTYVFYQGQLSLKYINSVKAHYLALSGIKYMGGRDLYAKWGSGGPPFPVTLSYGPNTFSLPGLNAGTFTIKREGSDVTHFVTLRSTGFINNVAKTMVFKSSGKEFIDLCTSIYGYPKGVYLHDLPVVEWKTEKD